MNVFSPAVGALGAGVRALGWGERVALEVLRSRLDSVAPDHVEGHAHCAEEPHALSSLPERMAGLLDRALVQTAQGGRAEFFSKIVDQLVPDEARILGALSDGSRSPLVRIRTRTRSGGVGESILENASLIGRTANAVLPALTPAYVAHLRGLGLVATGPEDPGLKEEYEILLAEASVLEATRSSGLGLGPVVERRSLFLSRLGQELWTASQPPT